MKVLKNEASGSGSVKINRIKKYPLSTDKNLKKQNRGIYDYLMDFNSSIFAVVRTDDNNFKILSNHQSALREKKVKRWNRQNKKQAALDQP